MAEDVTILSLADRERWVAEQQDRGLPSQSWDYACGMSASGVDPKLAVVRSKGARMLMPFYERAWNGTIDIATLLGLSGASIVPSSSAPLQLWREYAASCGYVAGYIQLSAAVTGEQTWQESVVQTNTVFWLSLRDIHLNALSPTIRQRIRKAEKQNVTLTYDRNVLLPSRKTLYPTTMQRVASPLHYRFSPETLDVWAAGPTSVLLEARVAGSIKAVSLFLVSGTHAEYHLNASTADGRAGRLLVPEFFSMASAAGTSRRSSRNRWRRSARELSRRDSSNPARA